MSSNEYLDNLPSAELLAFAEAEAATFVLPAGWGEGRPLRPDVYVIDEPYTQDKDDAIALTEGGETEARTLHVSIADVGSFLAGEDTDAIRRNARRRTKTTYLGNAPARRMIPAPVSENALSLLGGEERPVLTVSIPLDDRSRVLRDPTITREIIVPTALGYREVDLHVAGPYPTPHTKRLQQMGRVARQLFVNRHTGDGDEAPVLETEEGDFIDEISPGQLIVQESMILTGIVMSQYLSKLGIPVPFRNHVIPADYLPEVSDPAERLLLSHGFRASYGLEPLGHAALGGVVSYMHFPSPLRRFVDFAAHLNLVAFLEGRELPYPKERLQRIVDRINRLEEERAGIERQRLQALRRSRSGRVSASGGGEANISPYRRTELLAERFIAGEAGSSDIDIALFAAVGPEDALLAVKEQAAHLAGTNIYAAKQAINVAVARGHLTLRPANPNEFGSSVNMALEDAAGKVYPYDTKRSALNQALAAARLIGKIANIEVEPTIPPSQTREARILKEAFKYLENLSRERRIVMTPQYNQEPDGRVYCAVVVNVGNGTRVFEAVAESKGRAERQAAAAAIQELNLLGKPPEPGPAHYKKYANANANPVVVLSRHRQKAHAPPPEYSYEPDERFEGAFICTVKIIGRDGTEYPLTTGCGIGKKAAEQQAAAAMLAHLKDQKTK